VDVKAGLRVFISSAFRARNLLCHVHQKRAVVRKHAGSLAPFMFVVSLFKSNVGIYEVHNNGAWYNFAYLFGLTCFFGGGGNQAARRRKTAAHG